MTTLSETSGWTGFDGIPSSFSDECPVRLEDYLLVYLQYGTRVAILKILREEFILSFSANFHF
jgi:hypothetical protein